MELLDLEKHCNIEMDPEESTPRGHVKKAYTIDNQNEFMSDQSFSPRPSLDVPVLPSVVVTPRPLVSKRSSSSEFYRAEVLRKRRATRLGSTLDDPLNEKNEPDTPGACLARYVERASVPGLAYLYTSSTRLARMVWCAMLLFTMGMLTLHMFYLIDTYLSWPKHTKVTLGFDALQFPAVTFCNANPIRASQLHLASPDLRDLTDRIDPNALAQEMIKLSLMDLHHFAKNELQNQVEGTEFEEAVNEGFNQLDSFIGVGNNSPKKGRNSNTKKDDDNGEDSNSNIDAETTPASPILENFTVGGIGGSEVSNMTNSSKSTPSVLESDTTRGFGIGGNTVSNAAISTERTSGFGENTVSNAAISTERTTSIPDLGEVGDLFRDIFRGKRSLFKKKKVPSVNLPDVGDVDVDKASEIIADGQDELEQLQNEVNKQEITTSQAPIVTDQIDLNTSNGQSVENNTTEDQGKVCSQGLLPLRNGSNATGVANNITSDSDFSNATFCSMGALVEELNISNSSSGESTTALNEENTEELLPMSFINGLDIVGTNPRSEVELNVYAETANRFTERSTMARIHHQFTYLFTNETRSTRVKLGHRIRDMLVDCSFQGGRCYPSDFKLITSPTFGNCYTMDYPNLRVLRSGPDNGLSLIIFLENSEYLKGLTSSSGGHIVIHESNTFAFPDKDGLALAAGMEISIALRRTHISRLGQPHGDCNNGDEYMSTYQHMYTQRTCQNLCEHTLIATQCGCYDAEDEEVHRLLMLNSNVDITETPCHTLADFQCMLETERKYLTRELDCDCQNPCHDVTYTKTISSRQWPTDDFAVRCLILKKHYCETTREVLIQTLCETRSDEDCKTYKQIDMRQFSQNFLKVTIFYEDLNYENITEQASYELTQFYSDIGGALGLWMGLSMVAVLEVLHFLTSLGRLLASFVAERFTWFMDREKTGPLKQ